MGTKDEEAGYGGRPGVTLGAEETLAFFVERAGCSATRAVVSALPDEPGDRTRVERWDYPSCPTPFRFFRIEGGGHSWPGGVAAQGATHCTDVDGTREIIRFWRESAGLAPS
jgi:poly(3-hydroxybutyrate) depolymerase